MSLLDNLDVTQVRGVVRIGADCRHCAKPVPEFGLPGKGRAEVTFPKGYFCQGHAAVVCAHPVSPFVFDDEADCCHECAGYEWCDDCERYWHPSR